MTNRTSLKHADYVDDADDLENVVSDKRKSWRANTAKARRRQRRYKRVITKELLNRAKDGTEFGDEC